MCKDYILKKPNAPATGNQIFALATKWANNSKSPFKGEEFFQFRKQISGALSSLADPKKLKAKGLTKAHQLTMKKASDFIQTVDKCPKNILDDIKQYRKLTEKKS